MRNLLAILCLLVSACTMTSSPTVAIRGATLVDVMDGSLRPGQTVLIGGNRIVTVGPTGAVRIPDDVELLDAEGAYLIPGLWDMHVHSAASADWHFPLFLAHGVTGVRNMHTSVDNPLALTTAIKRRLAEGELLGPRFLANGPILDGAPAIQPGSVSASDPVTGRALVDSLAAAGADFIKVYDNLSPETYDAVLARARSRAIPVDGHLPMLIPAEVPPLPRRGRPASTWSSPCLWRWRPGSAQSSTRSV